MGEKAWHTAGEGQETKPNKQIYKYQIGMKEMVNKRKVMQNGMKRKKMLKLCVKEMV